MSETEMRTVKMTISIDFLLGCSNLMDYIESESSMTEKEVRDYLVQLKAEGHEVLPT